MGRRGHGGPGVRVRAGQHSFSRGPRGAPAQPGRAAGQLVRAQPSDPTATAAAAMPFPLWLHELRRRLHSRLQRLHLCANRRGRSDFQLILSALASNRELPTVCQVVPHVMVTKTHPPALRYFDSKAGGSFTSVC